MSTVISFSKDLSSANKEVEKTIENNRLVQLSRTLGDNCRQSFFKQKKLCLVLDLDQTLLQSVAIKDVHPEDQQYLNARVSSEITDRDEDGLYKYEHVGRVGRYTKLRPYTREFLKEASGMFELFIYTMGRRKYAQEIGRLLDPDGLLFNNNIVSKDDSTTDNRKNLDIMAGPNERNTIIIDDTPQIWPNNKKNLIRIDRYKYFTTQGFDDKDEALKSILKVLKNVHKMFFEVNPVPQDPVELEEYVKSVDVRPVLEAFRKKSRKGAVNCFSVFWFLYNWVLGIEV